MKPNRDLSSFSSLQQLIEELEIFMALESRKKSNPWISVAMLSNLFCEEYKVSLEEVAKAQGHNGSLRSLFTKGRFSIYGSQIPQNFYIALLQEVVSGSYQSQENLIKYTIKRPLKVDEKFLRTLKLNGAEENLSRQVQRISESQSTLVPEIKSVDDLEIALIEIIKSLIACDPKQFATITTLSKKFRDYYEQPIRTVMRTNCPGIKLIDLLQTIPNLRVQEVDNDWQIALEVHSVWCDCPHRRLD